MQPAIHVLTGCTAVGKTEWALRWAEVNDAEIISCDSLLFYRGMDLGTAKPTPEELKRVPHHLVDLLEVTGRMDVARYVTLAKKAVEEIAARGRRILVAGGSGFYLKSFFAPVADDVVVPEEIRAAVRETGLAGALAELRRLNPSGLGALDVDNPRRVFRALERCRASGKTVEKLAAEFAEHPAPFSNWRVQLTRLDRPPEELNPRIEARAVAMLQAGLVEEVERLLPCGLRENPSAARAIGYREVIAMIDGRLPWASLAEEIAKNTRALVKKQRTWFRTQLPPHRVILAGEASVKGLFLTDLPT